MVNQIPVCVHEHLLLQMRSKGDRAVLFKTFLMSEICRCQLANASFIFVILLIKLKNGDFFRRWFDARIRIYKTLECLNLKRMLYFMFIGIFNHTFRFFQLPSSRTNLISHLTTVQNQLIQFKFKQVLQDQTKILALGYRRWLGLLHFFLQASEFRHYSIIQLYTCIYA